MLSSPTRKRTWWEWEPPTQPIDFRPLYPEEAIYLRLRADGARRWTRTLPALWVLLLAASFLAPVHLAIKVFVLALAFQVMLMEIGGFMSERSVVLKDVANGRVAMLLAKVTEVDRWRRYFIVGRRIFWTSDRALLESIDKTVSTQVEYMPLTGILLRFNGRPVR